MSIFKRCTLILASACAALLLSSCGGVGDGSKPESLRILTRDGNLTQALLNPNDPVSPAKVYTCLRGVVGAFVTFTDGSIGDFSNRVVWTVNEGDEDIVQVSSREKPLPVPGSDDLFFASGTLIPLSTGTATLTATYLGMTATFPVEVLDAPSSIKVTPQTAVMAPRTFQFFRVTGVIDKAETDLGQFVSWAFDAPNDAVALTSTDGRVSAVAASPTPLQIRPILSSSCPVSPSATVRVATPTALSLEGEPGFYAAGSAADEQRLALGYSQALKVTATFADVDIDGVAGNDTQDMSEQVATEFLAYARGTETTSTAVGFSNRQAGRGNLVTGLAAGEVDVSARYIVDLGADGTIDGANETAPDDGYLNASSRLPLTVVSGPTVGGAVVQPLLSASISPSAADAVEIQEACGTARFKATGVFDTAVADPEPLPLSHDISRHVLWSLDADAVALPDPVVLDQLCNPAAPALATIDNVSVSLVPGTVRSFLPAGRPALAAVPVKAKLILGVDDALATAGDTADIVATDSAVTITPPSLP